MKVQIAYDRLAPLSDDPATIEPHLPLLDIGKRERLRPEGTSPAEPARKKQKLLHRTEPRPAVAAPQEKSEEEAGAGDGNLFEGDVLDMVLPASLAPASNTQKGTTIQTLDRDLPWMMSAHHITSPVLRLHNEIVDFCQMLAPTAAESSMRAAAISRITEVVSTIWPSAEVQVFGSFVTGLYLPNSDLDLVVMKSGCEDVVKGLKALATSLTRRSLATDIQVVAKAKVPIIKFKETETGLNFDISFDVENGPRAAQSVLDLMGSLPPMRPLVLILKLFLQQRELNEVYSGGVGSYALLVMVAGFLLLHPSREVQGSGKKARPGQLEPCLGILLLDFMRFYGRTINPNKCGISCREGGRFFSKEEAGFHQADRPFMLAVEDPQDPTNDLGKGTYHFSKVRAAFDYAYSLLTASVSSDESLLRRLFRLDDFLLSREVSPPTPADAPPPLPPTSPPRSRKSQPGKASSSGRRDTGDNGERVANQSEGREDSRYAANSRGQAGQGKRGQKRRREEVDEEPTHFHNGDEQSRRRERAEGRYQEPGRGRKGMNEGQRGPDRDQHWDDSRGSEYSRKRQHGYEREREYARERWHDHGREGYFQGQAPERGRMESKGRQDWHRGGAGGSRRR